MNAAFSDPVGVAGSTMIKVTQVRIDERRAGYLVSSQLIPALQQN